MRGYPKYVATVQDYKNLLGMDEHKDRALAELEGLAALKDETMSVPKDDKVLAVDGVYAAKDLKTVANPMPVCKIKGFSDTAAVTKLLGEVK